MRISSPETHLLLTGGGPGEEIKLGPTKAHTALSDASGLVLLGRPYDTEVEATEAAKRWRGLIQKAFARVNMGADFGDRANKSYWTKQGLACLEKQSGRRVLNNEHGTLVFECVPQPLFAGGGLTASKGVQAQCLVDAVAVAAGLDAVMSDRDQLAYDLYSASFSESSADARLAMLMMALETMIDPQPRIDAVRDHVDRLIAETQASGLARSEIDSITGSLSWLKDESISQAGRRLASQVGERKYMDEPPGRFFTKCYTLRSQLIPWLLPAPDKG